MNLNELFSIQAKLDERIVEEHGLQGEDLIDKKILALQVELGELAQNWRGFKFWSKDQKARTETQCHACEGKGFFDFSTPFSNEHFTEECGYCEGTGIQENRNPLLEEYVDCLHFILSVGLELGAETWLSRYFERTAINKAATITNYFLEVKYVFLHMGMEINLMEAEPQEVRDIYANGVDHFLGLGKKLGFTWEQIEQAYLDKNKINHERQTEGY
ncbi:dUTP diphosphatase [Oceanobacillus luteolus]|uniref:dUTP diphosphatase n=1 Tax=Oceanobacillus luteolus TaxID=1274358 RepID=UPI002041CCB5|nr:dUTP diphosphatase [Oceanobacillus luteolus]MCM3739216.1 dUTP diphosphatase [Oceanobacillus luteolus]